MNLLRLFFVLLFVFAHGQEEKRLALVIGNANYEKGELKNPVNDARLIASALDSLDFEVILKENLSTRRDMTVAIREFGDKRSDYDVAFVYYAGHGVQLNGENYLLPTEEVFEQEFDVIDNGVSVQNIMRYLKGKTNEVNILVLDACRDNPFESNWNATRSLRGGGLAKIPPPTGSIIAFSTDSGQTAPDGDGENSVYTTSLAKYMLLEDTSINQVFSYVRTEVLRLTKQKQSPVEESKLTGETFILNPGSFEKDYELIRKIIDDDSSENIDYLEGLRITNLILESKPNDKEAVKLAYELYWYLEEFDMALEYVNKSIELDPFYGVNNRYVARAILLYDQFNKKEEALSDYNTAVELEPDNDEVYYQRAMFYTEEEEWELALIDYQKSVELDPQDSSNYFNVAYAFNELGRYDQALSTYLQYIKQFGESGTVYNNMALIYRRDLEDYEKTLEYYNKAIDLEPEDPLYYSNRASLLYDQFNKKEEALSDYNTVVELDPENDESYYRRGGFYEREEEWELALIDYQKAVELDPEDSESYFNVAYAFNALGRYDQALSTYLQYIKQFGESDDVYYNMALIYRQDLEDYEKTLEYYNKAIDLKPEDPFYYSNRARLLYDQFNKKEEALSDYNTVVELDPENDESYFRRGVFYEREEEWELALIDYQKAVELDPEDSENYFNVAYAFNALGRYDQALSTYLQYIKQFGESGTVYNNMALIYQNDLEDYEKTLEYYNKAIDLEPEDPVYYSNRARLLYVGFNKKEEALSDLNRFVELKPEDDEGYYNRGDFYENEGELELALADYQKAVELDPQDSSNYFRVGFVSYSLERFDVALSTYLQYTKQFGENDLVYNNMALIYQDDLEDYEKALEYYNKAVEIDPNNPQIYKNRAVLFYNALDKKEEALSDFNRFVELKPEDDEGYYNRGDFYEREEEWELALIDYQKAVELDPEDSESYFNVAYAFSALGRYDQALSTYLQYIKQFGADEPGKIGTVYNNIAMIYEKYLEDYEKALEYYNKAVEINPNETLFYKNRARLFYTALDKKEEALSDFNTLVELEPSNHSIRAEFFHNIKEYGKAAEDYQSAINLGETVYSYSYNDLFYELGINLSLNGQYNEALKSVKKYSEGLNDGSSISFAYGEIAYIYQDGLKNLDKAMEYYLMGVKKDSLNTSNFIGLGELNLLKKDYDKSLMFFNKAIEIDPSEWNPYYARINFYIQNDMFDLAIKDVYAVRELSPEDPDSYYKEAIINAKLNKIKAIQDITMAIEKYNLSLKTDPNDSKYYIFSGLQGYLQKRIYLEDLYLFRSELLYKYNDVEASCDDLKLALNLAKSKVAKEKIKTVIEKNCN